MIGYMLNFFLQDYYYYVNLAGCTYEEAKLEKMFLKLPGPLGQEIYQTYKNWPSEHIQGQPYVKNIATCVRLIIMV